MYVVDLSGFTAHDEKLDSYSPLNTVRLDTMIDEIFEGIFDIILELIPDFVWGFLAVLGGVVSTVIGVMMITESVRIGGILVAVGLFLLVSVLYVWYR